MLPQRKEMMLQHKKASTASHDQARGISLILSSCSAHCFSTRRSEDVSPRTWHVRTNHSAVKFFHYLFCLPQSHDQAATWNYKSNNTFSCGRLRHSQWLLHTALFQSSNSISSNFLNNVQLEHEVEGRCCKSPYACFIVTHRAQSSGIKSKHDKWSYCPRCCLGNERTFLLSLNH